MFRLIPLAVFGSQVWCRTVVRDTMPVPIRAGGATRSGPATIDLR